MELTPRVAGMVGLLALLPVALFGFGKVWWAGIVTAVNVLLITLSLYLLMSPTEGESHDHDQHAA
jgi:hypothetical protein